ncbi:MAG: hypothetical protein DRJ42_01830 [Deltaproteobacteria bacterium]|nr:MAG: hypothetical protein DRJ42_01830 [Deltaproteobacteria bacterium]
MTTPADGDWLHADFCEAASQVKHCAQFYVRFLFVFASSVAPSVRGLNEMVCDPSVRARLRRRWAAGVRIDARTRVLDHADTVAISPIAQDDEHKQSAA